MQHMPFNWSTPHSISPQRRHMFNRRAELSSLPSWLYFLHTLVCLGARTNPQGGEGGGGGGTLLLQEERWWWWKGL